jgi:hypothetical protein
MPSGFGFEDGSGFDEVTAVILYGWMPLIKTRLF